MTLPLIAFDGTVLADGPVTGVSRAFLTTLAAYVAASPYRCVLLTPIGRSIPEVPDGVEVQACVKPGRWGRLHSLRVACSRLQAGVLHSPVTAVPYATCPTIATVHDLPWLYPELRREPGSRLFRRLAVHFTARTAAAVLVPSKATRRDLLRYAKIREDQIVLVHHGVPAPSTPADPDRLTGPFLVLGDDRPRKNGDRVRRAHARAATEDPTLPALRFVGPGHGYVPEEEKLDILRQTRALLHVSLLEGFGLPVLEAMIHGVPVVCSDRTSLPEVAAGAALHTDPTDEAAIAAAILRIHQDADLRDALRRRGLTQAAALTPERSAAGWLALHDRLLAGSN